ncbi:oxygenase MpaB family protein [Flavimarina sp. Hel_I_48]|uniref:oxygenase MpaB family protein n=1 Tax=Flavimarina sp. Hel_I_48 TaxID=1392488 RepID=UPI0004DFC796|nr:oxygenase MpaB family protein [Flavimarina sp. Hel_I_48]
MKYFVKEDSIVRKIWGKSDTVLLIFAGAAAEFALNKAVDWLYFTGKLPADPLGRLFSTVTYAREIIFADEAKAFQSIDAIYHIHKAVENSRDSTIPDWAYRDVLFMLIFYSISSFEVLERRLTLAEKEEIYSVFKRLGERMKLKDLAADYKSWLPQRAAHLENDLVESRYTKDLFVQYKKHLGSIRYLFLIEGQKLVIPERVRDLLHFNHAHMLRFFVPVYKTSRVISVDRIIKNIILPSAYAKEIKELDVANSQ